MAKRLAIKTGEYQKNGETKGEYVNIGVILDGQNGEFILLDAHVNLPVLLNQQNALNRTKQKPMSNKIMVSIFSDDNQQQGNQSNAQAGQSTDPYGDDYPDF